jgi:hypothetical protein
VWGLLVLVVAGFIAWRITRFIIWPPARTELPVIQGFRGVLRVPFDEDPPEPALRVYDNLSRETSLSDDVLKVPELVPDVARVVVPPLPPKSVQKQKKQVKPARQTQKPERSFRLKNAPARRKPRVTEDSIEAFLSRLQVTRKRKNQGEGKVFQR